MTELIANTHTHTHAHTHTHTHTITKMANYRFCKTSL